MWIIPISTHTARLRTHKSGLNQVWAHYQLMGRAGLGQKVHRLYSVQSSVWSSCLFSIFSFTRIQISKVWGLGNNTLLVFEYRQKKLDLGQILKKLLTKKEYGIIIYNYSIWCCFWYEGKLINLSELKFQNWIFKRMKMTLWAMSYGKHCLLNEERCQHLWQSMGNVHSTNKVEQLILMQWQCSGSV